MINFFRKIRYNLMEQNKTGKYFKYAIGEVVLVMVGILLALQVNNWNEDRVQQQKEIVNLIELKKSLESDLINEFIPGLAYMDNSKEALNNLTDFYTKTDDIFNDSLTSYFKRYLQRGWNFVFNTAAFENVKSTGIDIISNDELRSKIATIYSYEYRNIREGNKTVLIYFETQVQPVLSDHIDLFKALLSENEMKQKGDGLSLEADGTGTVIESLQIWEMNGIW